MTREAVIAESCYLLRHLPGACRRDSREREGRNLPLIPLPRSAPQLRRVFRKYRDREVDLADACLVHLADELGAGDILTLDRDFEVYRWHSNRRFRLMIPLS